MRNNQTGPAVGQFCDEHFSWLCQAGQGECQRPDDDEESFDPDQMIGPDDILPLGVTRPKATCSKCGRSLSACITCGGLAGCGEAWCEQHLPDDDDSLDSAPYPPEVPGA